RWAGTQQRLICPHWIVPQVDGGEQSAEQVPEARRGEYPQSCLYLRVATPPGSGTPVPVVAFRVAVQAHAHQYAQLVEDVEERGAEQGPVGLQVNLDLYIGVDGGTDCVHCVAQMFGPRKQGFAAVKYQFKIC